MDWISLGADEMTLDLSTFESKLDNNNVKII